MYEYFTPYRKIYIIYNINLSIGLINRTPYIIKSILFNDNEYNNFVKTQIKN